MTLYTSDSTDPVKFSDGTSRVKVQFSKDLSKGTCSYEAKSGQEDVKVMVNWERLQADPEGANGISPWTWLETDT